MAGLAGVIVVELGEDVEPGGDVVRQQKLHPAVCTFPG